MDAEEMISHRIAINLVLPAWERIISMIYKSFKFLSHMTHKFFDYKMNLRHEKKDSLKIIRVVKISKFITRMIQLSGKKLFISNVKIEEVMTLLDFHQIQKMIGWVVHPGNTTTYSKRH